MSELTQLSEQEIANIQDVKVMEVEMIEEKQDKAVELVIERDELISNILELIRDTRVKLGMLSAIEAELLQAGVHSPNIFGDFMMAVEQLFTQKAYLGECRAYFGIPPKPSRKDDIVASAEMALSNARETLKRAKEKQSKSFTLKSGAPTVTADDVERAQKWVEQAELNLLRARGELKAYKDEQAAKREAKREAEQAEAIAATSSWQSGWRSYAKDIRDKRDKASSK